MCTYQRGLCKYQVHHSGTHATFRASPRTSSQKPKVPVQTEGEKEVPAETAHSFHPAHPRPPPSPWNRGWSPCHPPPQSPWGSFVMRSKLQKAGSVTTTNPRDRQEQQLSLRLAGSPHRLCPRMWGGERGTTPGGKWATEPELKADTRGGAALLWEADFGPCRPDFLMGRFQVKRLEFFDEERLLKQSCA